MFLRRLYFTFVCLVLAHTVLARVDKALWKTYKVAKKYYAAADYVTAKDTLASLINAAGKTAITPYALFYYALSAYHNEELVLAENTFTTIRTEYPHWEQKDEVWYWLGQLRFEAQDYCAGLACLDKITDQTFAALLGRMKIYFLSQLDDMVMLQELFRKYPKDQDIAKVLFDKAVHQPLVSRDLDLIDILAHNFNLVENDPLQALVSFKKDSYNVGVFFPFFVDEVDYEEESSNFFVIALYQGIKMAVTALADQGIAINLVAYDTKKDPVTTAALLAQEEVKSLDLIVGPLYAATIPLVADFARAHQINMFNPLSENTDVVGDNPFAFLFQSSLETQAKKAAEFTLHESLHKELSVGIIYGTSKADVIQAYTYKQHIERSTGRDVALMCSMTPDEAQGALNILRESTEGVSAEHVEENQTPILLDGLTHVYVASKDELIIANVLSVVDMLECHRPYIILHNTWLQQSSFTFDQLERLPLYLVAPNYIDYSRRYPRQVGIDTFRSDFYDQFAQYPNTHACTGYEMMLFLGHMLAQYGVYFQKHWTQDFYRGAIFDGITYGGLHHDNQHVPILGFQKQVLFIYGYHDSPYQNKTYY